MAEFTSSSTSNIHHKEKFVPWVEKHRPEKVEDVASQEELTSALKKSIQIGNIPHLLFHGPPGTGKTTTILALARALFSPEHFRSRILELNASDERGISVVRDKIKVFAQGAVSNHKVPGYPCPKFKMIILDEADTMTPEAQSALRRIIEKYSNVTRFILICNYVTRIIEPLASRCAKFRFKQIPLEAMKQRLLDISAKEHVSIDENAILEIIDSTQGDMRKSVTFLQSCHQLTCGKELVTKETVGAINGKIPSSFLENYWKQINSMSFDLMKDFVQDFIYEGYALTTFLQQIQEYLLLNQTIVDVDKALIAIKIAEIENNLLDGSSEFLQLLDLSSYIMRTVHKL